MVSIARLSKKNKQTRKPNKLKEKSFPIEKLPVRRTKSPFIDKVQDLANDDELP